MILGASLGSFLNYNLADACDYYLKLSRDFEISTVEIRFEKEIGRPSSWYWEETKLLREFTENFPVCGAHLPFIHLNPVSQNPGIQKESREQLKKSICAAADLNLKYTVMHIRGDFFPRNHLTWNEKWTEIITDLLDYSTDSGIQLTIENADNMTKLSDLVTFIKKINNSKLKLTLDIGHAYIRKIPPLSEVPVKDLLMKTFDIYSPIIINNTLPFSEYNTISHFISEERNLIGNIHIHDYNGLNDHLEIGKGKIDFSFIEECSQIMPFVPITMEINFANPLIDFSVSYNKIHNEV